MRTVIDIYCGTTADETDLDQHGGPVEVNIWQPDHTGVASCVGTYLAPSTVVVVERTMDNVIPTTSNAIQLTSAFPSYRRHGRGFGSIQGWGWVGLSLRSARILRPLYVLLTGIVQQKELHNSS